MSGICRMLHFASRGTLDSVEQYRLRADRQTDSPQGGAAVDGFAESSNSKSYSGGADPVCVSGGDIFMRQAR